ncbi:MAG: class I SAM-dependent methyltransferase [Bacteroidales bacterium]|jgi:predicted O-methyltransferase YrrM|nr:class I SAM-dependent methyltransferase [Bacteroidales bacterium]
MSNFFKALKAVGLILRKPYLLNLICDDETVKQNYIEKKYHMSAGLPTIDISNFINSHEEVTPYSFLEGSSLPTDLALLRAICRKNNVVNYLEIGTWRGESAANVSPLVKNCFTINLPDEEMLHLGMDDSYIEMHRFFSKGLPNVTHIQANSMTFDFSSLNKKFDLIFIDGDHHTEVIASDTKNAFKLLKDNNSVIVWHDYGLTTETPRFNVLAGILDGCPAEYRDNLYHVSNTLCAIFTKESLVSKYRKSNTNPSKYFNVLLNVKDLH